MSLTRRTAISVIAAGTATGGLARAATSPSSTDQVFAAIEAHKAATKEWRRLNTELDEQQSAAMKRIGPYPSMLIDWRNYTIGGTELKYRRDDFIARKIADADTIEAEYRDAMRRYAKQQRKKDAWDRRAGIAELRAQAEAAKETYRDAGERLADIVPTTVAGAAALLGHALHEALDEVVGDLNATDHETQWLINANEALQALTGVA
jgi:hypothetical protein